MHKAEIPYLSDKKTTVYLHTWEAYNHQVRLTEYFLNSVLRISLKVTIY